METIGHAYIDTRMHMHASDLCMHARVPEIMKGKFFALKLRFGMNLTSSGGHSKPPFSQYKKPYMEHFQNT